jgi:hypothetical protein
MKNRLVFAMSALALVATPALSFAQTASGIAASPTTASPELTSARAAGDFAAVIAPVKGYKGSRFVGKMPKVTLQQTPETRLDGSPAGPPPPSSTLKKFWPDDMGYFGGPVVASTSQVNVYWANDNGSIWGGPATYEADLNVSTMAEILDQYTFQVVPTVNKWPVASYWWYFPGGGPGALIYDSQVAAEVQALATADRNAGRQSSFGTNVIYHVFLPPGTDECFNNPANGCYNPDGHAPGPFVFCAYHSYTHLPDGSVVLYSVEPYMSVNGCSTGKGLLNDTANVLGHETAEAISDPEPGSAWVGKWPDSSGSEIGDDCSWTIIKQTLNTHTYYTQNWYSNKSHACNQLP